MLDWIRWYLLTTLALMMDSAGTTGGDGIPVIDN